MRKITLDQVLKATKGELISKHAEIFKGIGTDTRTNMKNQLFIALRGDQFDAHQFLGKAAAQEAAGILIDQESGDIEELKKKLTIVKVKDTLVALQNLAQEMRRTSPATVIGIAGSNGKTTSKEFCKALFSQYRRTHSSKGSLNNHWGVPFTLLSQAEDAQVAVVEMGMNHQNELALLAKIAEPDIVVCTYVGVEHIEHFGSLENIAKAEQEIYDHSPATAKRIYNIDNAFTQKMFKEAKTKFPKAKAILTFSESEKADVNLSLTAMTMHELQIVGQIGGVKGAAVVPVFGRHNLTNLMVCATAGLAAGLTPEEIWVGLAKCRTSWGRNQLLKAENGAEILFDGYNSNPDSMKALVQNLSLLRVPGKLLGVFAEMKELGKLSAQMHRETGAIVGTSNLEKIWFYGEHFEDFTSGLKDAGFKGKIFSTAGYDDEIAKKIAEDLKKDDMAVVKGSRGMELERFVKKCRPLNFLEK